MREKCLVEIAEKREWFFVDVAHLRENEKSRCEIILTERAEMVCNVRLFESIFLRFNSNFYL